MKNKKLLFALLLALSSALLGVAGENIFEATGSLTSLYKNPQTLSAYTAPVALALFYSMFFFRGRRENAKKYTSRALLAILCLYIALFLYIATPIPKVEFITAQTPKLFKMLSAIFIPFVLWSYMSMIYTYEKAIKDYFVIIVAFIVFSLSKLVYIPFGGNLFLVYLYSIAGLLSLIKALSLIKDQTPAEEIEDTNDKIEKPSTLLWLKMGALLAIPVIITTYIMVLFKYRLKAQNLSPSEYMEFCGNFMNIEGLAGLLMAIPVLIITYTCLKKRSLQSIISIFCTALLVICLISIVIIYYTSSLNIYPVIALKATLLNVKFYAFFPLLQLLYLKLKSSERYKAIILTEVIFFQIFCKIAPGVQDIMILLFDGFNGIKGTSTLICAAALIVVLFYLGREKKPSALGLA